jgi:hypothetical protein
VKLLIVHKHPPELPIPSHIRQHDRIDYWRDRIWRVRNEWFVLLGPQFRELVRRICFGCNRAGNPEMVSHLRVGLFFLWFMTGNIKKMEDFVVAIFSGGVFLMNLRLFFSDNRVPDVPSSELLKRVLLYDPIHHKGGVNQDRALKATRFSTYLGPVIAPKPWIEDWVSEKAEVRKQAVAELGARIVQDLWSPNPALNSEDEGCKPGNQQHKLHKNTSYW